MACQLLVKRYDNENPPGEMPIGMNWTRGLVVNIIPYYVTLGEMVDPDKTDFFLIIVVLDMDKDEMDFLLDAPIREGPHDPFDPATSRRIWKLYVDEFPTSMLTPLNQVGRLEVTVSQLRGYIRNQETGEVW
jgi:hypothetical protein